MSGGAGSVGAGGLVDVGRLTAWLDEYAPGVGSGPLAVEVIHGGTSNVLVALERGGESAVLRRPPAVPPPNSARAIVREARVLAALNGTGVPHPFCYGVCEDVGVIGAPFYVMRRVQGWAGELRGDRIVHRAPFDGVPFEYGVPYAMVDGIVALANVDHVAVGLGDFGKPGRFLARQVDRWAGQLRSYGELYGYRGRELPGYGEVEGWLRAHVPAGEVSGIIHGDMGTPNALFGFEPPARLNALIDWELSTVGDPLLDLGWLTSELRDEREPGRVRPNALYNVENMPTRQELVRYYAAGTGRDVSNFDYYLILALFKVACVLEYKVAQAEAGIIPREKAAVHAGLVTNSLAEAVRIIASHG